MSQATLNQNQIAATAGEQTVYNFTGDTREYLASSVEYLAVGVGIPANSTVDTPLAAKTGFALCRKTDNSSWEYVADHRGETVYNQQSGEASKMTVLGDYPDGVTTLKPATPYDVWNGSAWITDGSAQKAALIAAAGQDKTQRLNAAKERISLWQTELQLGIISDDDKASLIAWLEYIKLVQAVDTASAPDINWPEQPQ